jgi:hypothetical protein
MAKRKGPPPGEPPPEPAPEPESGPPEPEPPPRDLTESSALVILSDSEVRRIDESGDDLEPPPPPEDLGESRVEKPAPDLTESSALVIMSASDVQRFDSDATPPPPSPPKKKPRSVPPKPPPERPPPPEPPPPRGRLGPALLVTALLLLVSAVTAYTVHSLDEDARRRDIAALNEERDRLRERTEGRESALESALAAERAAKDRELEALRRDLEAERKALGERAAALEAEARKREEEARAQGEALRDSLRGERDAAAAAAAKAERERAERERLDLERRVKETVERYEALLGEADKRREAEAESDRRAARAEILRREALAKKKLEEEKAALEREKAAAIAAETERIEARLRAEQEEKGGLIREKGEGAEAGAGGIDLEQQVWHYLTGHLGGSVEYRLDAYLHDSAQPEAQRATNEAVVKLKYDASFFGDAVSVKVVPRVRVDDDRLSYSTQEELEDERTRRPVFTFEEAVVAGHFGAFDVALGKQIFAWGTGDIVNPTDVVNPVDYTDLIDSEKIGVFALDASLYPGADTRLRLILEPTFTPARLPLAGHRFSLLPPDGIFLPPPPPLTSPIGPLAVGERDLPEDGLPGFAAAFRASTTLGGWDVSATYYAGVNHLPNFQVRPLGAAPFASITPVYDRIHMVGLDFATTFTPPVLGEIQAHGEAAQFLTEGGRDDDYAQYVLGIEKNFSDPVFEKEAMLVLEYAGQIIEVARSRTDIIPATQFARAFTNAVLARLTWKPIEHLELLGTMAAIVESPQSYYFRPEVRYELGTHTKIAAGFDFMTGSRSGFFGQFAEDDRFFLSLKLVF